MRDPEIASFDNLWRGGYFEGDPLDPHARSHYSAFDIIEGIDVDLRKICDVA